MAKISLTALLFILGFSVFGQLNVRFTGQLEYAVGLNDIWGYQAEDGTEYALVGLTTGFSIVSLADPSSPVELFYIPGTTSTWRDIKTWEHYAYVVTEAPDGILIVDMQYLPDSIAWKFENTQVGPFGDSVVTNHNIFIDEGGIIYLSGGNLNNGGVVLLDAATDPWTPGGIGFARGVYSHDAFARDSLLYSSDIYAGELSIQDVSDPKNISVLGTVKTPSEFTHNAWLSDDSKYIFTTDERSNGYVASYDLSDPGNIKEVDRYRPAATLGEGVIPHNVHVYNDYLVISYYTDGCIIVDASRPDNLIETGNYDTYSGPNGGFNGAWGAYPFLPSGLILVSDRENGLFVLEPDYVRGCYLEGIVRDGGSANSAPLVNVKVEIITTETLEPVTSKLDGVFKTGKALPGTFDVRFSKAGFRDTIIEVTLENGVLTYLDVELTPLPRYKLAGHVRKRSDAEPLPNARVLLYNESFQYETEADFSGAYLLEDIYEGSYKLFAGTWGQYTVREITIGGALTEELVTEPGYYDDFHFDFGWQISGSSTGSDWIRGVPNSELLFNFFQCNPAMDVPEDLGARCFMTGNIGGNAKSNDVDNGYTLLSSPVMDLTGFSGPKVSYRPWICAFGEPTLFSVLLTNGQDTVSVDTITSDEIAGTWQDTTTKRIEDYIAITDRMQVHFYAWDPTDGDDENILKAAVDQFIVTGDSLAITSTEDFRIAQDLFSVFPNPFDRQITIRTTFTVPDPEAELRLLDSSGRILFRARGEQILPEMTINPDLLPGMYFIQMRNRNMTRTAKVLKVQ